jgi:hypothetical protein
MAPSTSTTMDERLPASLFTIYQTYKRGTAVIIDRLKTFEKAPVTSPCLTQASPASDCLTVKQILQRARKASKRNEDPPENIHDAFRISLVLRNKLSKYYEGLPVASAEAMESTQRHRFFNETLAQAYALLFPRPAKSQRDSTKLGCASTQVDQLSPSNTFEVLSATIEKEPEYESSASLMAD